MKRTPMRRTKPLRQRRAEGADVEREVRPWAAALAGATVKPLHAGSYAGSTEAAAPKPATYRDPVLLEMAHNRPCLFLVPGICNHRLDTTVACHENEGKGMGIKAPDNRSVWGCYACHTWYDQGTAPRGYKRELFAQAMDLQALAWADVAGDATEPLRFRRAARRALERITTTREP